MAVPRICRHLRDDMFVASHANSADYIVLEDLDLLSPGEYDGILLDNSQTMIELLNAANAG